MVVVVLDLGNSGGDEDEGARRDMLVFEVGVHAVSPPESDRKYTHARSTSSQETNLVLREERKYYLRSGLPIHHWRSP